MIGLSGCRGSCRLSHGSGTTRVSKGASTVTLRTAVPRTSASAWATDGGPASAATTLSDRRPLVSTRRRSPAGSTLSSRRSGECATLRSESGSHG